MLCTNGLIIEYRELKLFTENTYCCAKLSPGEAMSSNSSCETSFPIPGKTDNENIIHCKFKFIFIPHLNYRKSWKNIFFQY